MMKVGDSVTVVNLDAGFPGYLTTSLKYLVGKTYRITRINQIGNSNHYFLDDMEWAFGDQNLRSREMIPLRGAKWLSK